MSKVRYRWICHAEDPKRGCFHPDWKGRCYRGSKYGPGFKTKEAAKKAAAKHRCKFSHGPEIHIYEVGGQ